jgi:hypothetical protein
MKIPHQTCKVNGIQVTEVDIKSMPNTGLTMNAVYALGEFKKQPGVDPTAPGTGHILAGTHGRCTSNTNNWSERTMKLLKEMLASMEEDLLPRHFEETAGLEDEHAGIESGRVEEARQI